MFNIPQLSAEGTLCIPQHTSEGMLCIPQHASKICHAYYSILGRVCYEYHSIPHRVCYACHGILVRSSYAYCSIPVKIGCAYNSRGYAIHTTAYQQGIPWDTQELCKEVYIINESQFVTCPVCIECNTPAQLIQIYMQIVFTIKMWWCKKR